MASQFDLSRFYDVIVRNWGILDLALFYFEIEKIFCMSFTVCFNISPNLIIRMALN